MTGRMWRFHHIGISASSSESLVKRLTRIGGVATLRFEDELQGVRGLFVDLGGVRVEVLSKLDDHSTLDPWLAISANYPYQIAFEVDDLDYEIAAAGDRGARLVKEPQAAPAFGGRRVAFLMVAPGFLIELIEAPNINGS